MAIIEGEIFELLQMRGRGPGEVERLMRAEDVVGGHRGEELDRAAGMGAAIVRAAEQVPRLLLHLDDQDGSALLARRRLEAGAELQSRQIVREQEVALDGLYVDRTLGRDL